MPLLPNEAALEFPGAEAPLLPAGIWAAFTSLPGRCMLAMDPPRSESGGILLSTRGNGYDQEGGAAEMHRADCGTVVSVGDVPEGWGNAKERRSALWLRDTVRPGMRVMVRPFSGTRMQEARGFRDIACIGITDPWEEDIVLFERDGRWLPLSNWLAIELEEKASAVLTTATTWKNSGRVLMAGPTADAQVGERVALHSDLHQQRPDDTKWLSSLWGPFGPAVRFVRETDCEGVRRVLALLEAA